jgi:hypothetical protein
MKPRTARRSALLFAAMAWLSCFTQTTPRSWQDHLSLNSCISVARLGKTVYASYYNGLVKFDESELAPAALTKVNGLGDVGIRLVRVNSYNNKLLVIYDNCNIDVIDASGNITNYPDFKMKTLSGLKNINEVTFRNKYAYLACGFGIVVFDTEKLEIKDTYYIGPNGSNLEVYQVAFNDSLVFAATATSMFTANHKKSPLNDFRSWKPDTVNLPRGAYSAVICVKDTVIAAYSFRKKNPGVSGKDTVYTFRNGKWMQYPPLAGGQTVLKMGSTYGNLFFTLDAFGMVVRDIGSGSIRNLCYEFNGQKEPVQVSDVYFNVDHSGNVAYWIADNLYGLYRSYIYYMPLTRITRNGMNKSHVGGMDVFEGKLAVAPGYPDMTGIGSNSGEGINIYDGGEWSYLPAFDNDGNKVLDMTSVLFDRKDKRVMWVASWYYGILKYENYKLVQTYTLKNTPELSNIIGQPRCIGLSMDKDGNVWFAQSDQSNFLGVIRRKDGKLISLKFSSAPFIRRTMVDRNNNVWMLHERDGGITVYRNRDNSFSTPTPTVNYKIINKESGTGNIGSNAVFSIAEDLDGKIWIGTDAGVRVLYSPSSIFSGGDYDAQPIKIVQDGNVELLLEKETVLAIAVDGANNKWVGTLSGGVYCFSPDGQKQIYHFTKENSPLYSNRVLDLNYNGLTGDVFFATDYGVQSFKSTILKGSETFDNIAAYPNPVRPGYAGTVLVRGLLSNSIVKVTDESGNLVWETKAEGGQVEWPVQTLSGSRVASGVYLIYATGSDGEARAMTKVLVMN